MRLRSDSCWFTRSAIHTCVTALFAFCFGCGPGTPPDATISFESFRREVLRDAETSVRRAPIASAPLRYAPARYVLRDGPVTVFFGRSEIAFAFGVREFGSWGLFWRFEGARDVEPVGDEELEGRVNHLVGAASAWETDLPAYKRVVYEELWPGVKLEVEPRRGAIAYRLVLDAGADASNIQFAWDGADIDFDSDHGGLKITADWLTLRESGLRCFDAAADFGCRYRGLSSYGFELDASGKVPVVIDPVIDWSSYLGGADSDHAYAVAVDGSGSAFVVGDTHSTDYPNTAGFQTTIGGSQDAFVTKIAPDGASVVWSSFLGGAANDYGDGIAVDGSGAVYVVGWTESPDFPAMGGFSTTLKGMRDAFVAKVDPAGSSLSWSSYLGGSTSEGARAVAVDTAGSVFVTGFTTSTDFPAIGWFDTSLGGTTDAFVSEIASTGAAIVRSTYLGGSGVDRASGIAVDASGGVHVTGMTESADFPIALAFDATLSGGQDAFVAKFSTSSSWSTYLGGSGATDDGNGIAVDSSGNVYITGRTNSADFPTTGAFDSTRGGPQDAYVTKLSSAGTLVWSSYLGGEAGFSGYDEGMAIAIDAQGGAYVTGWTLSTDFPVERAFDGPSDGGDVFVSKVAPDGSGLEFSSYLGGSNIETGEAIAVDGAERAYVAGETESIDFANIGGFDPFYGGFGDAFVSRIETLKQLGSGCSTPDECTSAICEDALCCAMACDVCKSCDPSGSMCSAFEPDGTLCPGGTCVSGVCEPTGQGNGGGAGATTASSGSGGKGGSPPVMGADFEDNGCGCRTGRSDERSRWFALAAAFLLSCIRKRRRRE